MDSVEKYHDIIDKKYHYDIMKYIKIFWKVGVWEKILDI